MGRAPEGLCRPQGGRGGNRRGDHKLRQGAHRPLQGPGRRRVRRRAPQDLHRKDPEVPAARAGVGRPGTARRLAPPHAETATTRTPSGFFWVLIEATPGLPAEPASADQLFEEAWGGVVGLAELVVDVGDHIEAHVEADEVAELERPDRETRPLSEAHTARSSPNAPLTSRASSECATTLSFSIL